MIMNLSTIRQKQKQLQELIGQQGAGNACLYLINRMTSSHSIPLSFNKYYFVTQLLNTQPLLPPQRGRQLNVVELIQDQITPHPCPRPEAVIKDRYDQGATCLAAYNNKDFAGCLWFAASRFREDEVRCVYELLSSEYVWDFDVYVEPQFRLSPVFLKLWEVASTKLVEAGFKHSLSRISAFNMLSLASHKRMGAKIIGWAVFMNLKHLQLTFTSMKPYFHVSWSPASMPTFQFN
jgi:hypothetical protein